jgi:hypothetical protein
MADGKGELIHQRERTDRSLDAERAKTDRTLQERAGRNEDAANAEIAVQRLQADTELREQRESSDHRRGAAQEPSADPRQRLLDERTGAASGARGRPVRCRAQADRSGPG